MGSTFPGALNRVRSIEVTGEPLVPVGRGESDPTHAFVRVEPECVTRSTLGDAREGRAVTLDPARALADASAPRTQLEARALHERASRQVLEELEGRPVADAGQDDGRGKEGKEALTRSSPAAAGLAQVLQAGESQHALAAAFGDDAREPGQGSDVSEFVQGEQEPRTLVVAVIGGVDQFIDETHDEWCRHRLVSTGRDDMELVWPGKELIDVERCLTCRSACGVGAHAREQTRGR